MQGRQVTRGMLAMFAIFAGYRAGVALAQTTAQAEVGSERRANLSGPEQIREAARTMETMNGTRRRVSEMLDRARQERDIIKVNCLNDKLNQIDVTLRSGREHSEMLQTASAVNNDRQRDHEYALITIFGGRTAGLEAEARQCIGEEASLSEETTERGMRIRPTIPEVDTTNVTPTSSVPEIPVALSPVR